VEYQRIAAACLSLVFSTDGVPLGGLVLERCGWGMCGLVFGTLLGPEATGPWFRPVLWGGVAGLFVSGFLAAPIAHVDVWGVWFGVVV
jgi:hypothetical protein